MDYDDFKLEVDDIFEELRQEKDDFDLKKRQNAIVFPIKPEPIDKKFIDSMASCPSVIDELKEKIKNLKSKVGHAPVSGANAIQTHFIPQQNSSHK